MSNYDFQGVQSITIPVNCEVGIAFGDSAAFAGRTVDVKMVAAGSNLTLHTFAAPGHKTFSIGRGELILELTGSSAASLPFTVVPTDRG